MKTPATVATSYPIRAVSKLTGIPIDTLRAWERRYGVVAPTRDGRGRLYSKADVERLRLLQQVVSSGHSVGRAAALSGEELQELARPGAATAVAAPAGTGALLDTSAFTAALGKLDGAAVDHEFSRLATMLPPVALVQDVILPALREVGEGWNKGRGAIAREHLMSATMRHLLGAFLRLYARGVLPTRLLFATPSGDRHEMGILGAALLAASRGFNVTYLGPDLPALEIVDATKAADAQVLVLGITLTTNGKSTDRELRTILRDLPASVELWVGGAGAARSVPLLGARGHALPDFDAYLQQLARLGAGALTTPRS